MKINKQTLSVTSQFLNDDFLVANRLFGYERQITQSLGESPRRRHKSLNSQPNHAGNFFTRFDLSFTPGRCKLPYVQRMEFILKNGIIVKKRCICHFVKWQIRPGVKLKYKRAESLQQDLVVSWEICARVWGTLQVIESSDVDYRGGSGQAPQPRAFPTEQYVTQRWLNNGPVSHTSVRHWTRAGLVSRVLLVVVVSIQTYSWLIWPE